MRDSFIFYKSFYEGIKELTTEEQAMVVLEILRYQFEDNFSENLQGVPKAIFALIRPQLDANNQRYENGCKGGAPKGNENAKKQNNQKTTKKQPNENENENENEKDISSIEEEDFKHDFEILWSKYPRKEGKLSAYKHYKSWMKGRDTLLGKKKLTNEQILSAIEEYCRVLKERGTTDKKYIKMGDTFFNNDLLDFLPEEGVADG